MKTIIDIYESILGNIEDAMSSGENTMRDYLSLYKNNELVQWYGMTDNTEKMFNEPALEPLFQQNFMSETADSFIRGYRMQFSCGSNFVKWIERLTAEALAAAIENKAKKDGILKNSNKIRIRCGYEVNQTFHRGQLDLYVEKIDKEGNVVITRSRGPIQSVYIFKCK
jgi:hypothetical protein